MKSWRSFRHARSVVLVAATAIVGTMVLAGASAAQTSTYWTLASSTGPSARQAEMTVVDTPRDRMILFGGKSTNTDGTVVTNYDDTWAYSFATP